MALVRFDTNSKATFRSLEKVITAAFLKLNPGSLIKIKCLPLSNGTLRIQFDDAINQSSAIVEWGDIDLISEKSPRNKSAGRLILTSGDSEFGKIALKSAGAGWLMTQKDPRFNLIKYHNRNLQNFICDDHAMDRIIATRLGVGTSNISDFIFIEAHEQTGPKYKLVFEKNDKTSIKTCIYPNLVKESALLQIGLFAIEFELHQSDGTRIKLENENDINALADDNAKLAIDTICFLLNRSIHKEMALSIPDASAYNPDGAGGDEDNTFEGKAISTTDFSPEIAWRRFFTPFEIERDAICDFRPQDKSTMVQHGELECNFIQPILKDAVSFHKPLWRLVTDSDTETHGYMTYLDDNDLIMGESEKLDELLSRVRKAHTDDEYIFLNETCVSKIIGEDTPGIIRRHKNAGGSSVLYLDISLPGPSYIISNLLEQIKDLTIEKFGEEILTNKEPRSIALIGYPLDRSMQELQQWIGNMGIRKSAALLPQFGIDPVKQALSSELIVASQARDWNKIARDIFVIGDKKHISPTMPFGIKNTYNWIVEIAEELGIDNIKRKVKTEKEKDWDYFSNTYQEKLSECGVAFIADINELARIINPASLFGVPLLSFLDELGVNISLLLYSNNPDHDVTKAKQMLSETIENQNKLSINVFSQKDELFNLLKSSDNFQTVYSQYSFDRRLYQAGKTSFSLLEMEKGIKGAERTAKKIISLCKWNMPKKWGKYISAQGWSE